MVRVAMIDHVSIAVRDLDSATRFYEAALAPLGYTLREVRRNTVAFGKKYSEFWLNLRAGLAPLPDNNGCHIALRASSPEAVQSFHDAALAAGATSDGAPGLRPQHGEGYYAAFIRDPDGNRIEAVTFLEVKK
jgi:catechol 2,3-dioxygenase-like lactoylglutathione lyase family enzyme